MPLLGKLTIKHENKLNNEIMAFANFMIRVFSSLHFLHVLRLAIPIAQKLVGSVSFYPSLHGGVVLRVTLNVF